MITITIDCETIGDVLYYSRIKKHLSLRDVSKYVDITAAYLSDIESGKRFPVGSIKIAKACELYGLDHEAVMNMCMKEKCTKKIRELEVKMEEDGND